MARPGQTLTLLSPQWHTIIADIIATLAQAIKAAITGSPPHIRSLRLVPVLLLAVVLNAIVSDEIAATIVAAGRSPRWLLEIRLTLHVRFGVSVVIHGAIAFDSSLSW
jgi:hypothetical protein